MNELSRQAYDKCISSTLMLRDVLRKFQDCGISDTDELMDKIYYYGVLLVTPKTDMLTYFRKNAAPEIADLCIDTATKLREVLQWVCDNFGGVESTILASKIYHFGTSVNIDFKYVEEYFGGYFQDGAQENLLNVR